jgi:hypothetical protein
LQKTALNGRSHEFNALTSEAKDSKPAAVAGNQPTTAST